MNGIIGKKLGMTSHYNEDGSVIPVTVIEAGPCVVVQKKKDEKDGYNAIQLGFEDQKEERKLLDADSKMSDKLQTQWIRKICMHWHTID